jgi:hypothetical protein
MVALLAAVAISLTGQPTLQLECGPLPDGVSTDAYGAAVAGTHPRIWLLPRVCRSASRGEHLGLAVLAHEILHVRVRRPHWWIYRWDDWYAENVVRWKLERLRS